MATCRFLLANRAEGSIILNGSGGIPFPPARSEVAPFIMDRALNDDRRSLHKFGAANDVLYFGLGYQMEVDLGTNALVSGFALHGLSCPGGEIQSAEVGYYNTYPSATPVPVGAWATANTYPPRDLGFTFTEVGKQYWYSFIGASAAPIVGRFKFGQLVDLGVAPNPGSSSSPYKNRLEQVLEDGSVITNEVGYPGRDITLNFSPITAATVARIDVVTGFSGPVTYFDQDNNCFECIVKGGRVEMASVGGGLFSAQLSLMRLP